MTGLKNIPWYIYTLYSAPPAFLLGLGGAKDSYLYYLIPFIVGGLIGAGISELYRRKFSSNEKVLAIFIWFNIITWIFPVIGFSTGLATANLYASGNISDKKKALFLAHLAVYLSTINLFLAALLK